MMLEVTGWMMVAFIIACILAAVYFMGYCRGAKSMTKRT